MNNIQLFRLLRYICVGVVGTVFQYMILIILVSTGSTGPVAASSVGAIVGAIINYILNYHFTFRSRENHARAASRFFFVAIMGFGVNWVAMTVMVNVFALHYILAQIASTCLVLMLTFSANATWSFSPKRQSEICTTFSPIRSIMTNKSIFFSSNVKISALIIGVSLVALFLLIANPGYYSHDELQKFDHVTRHGFRDYFLSYVRIHQGDTFGTPVRPFSFLIQGGLAFFMENYPVLVHLFAVLIHATVACLLFVVLLRFGASKSLGLTIALVFVVNPLSLLATGWSAALMDQWYVLFGLVTLIFADRYVRNEQGDHLLFGIFINSVLAMLSKETAIVLPGLMFLMWLIKPDILKTKRFWLALAVWATPIFLFMIYRLPALIASFGHPTVSAYAASIHNVPSNLLVYLAYPFLYMLTEAGNWVFFDPLWIWSSLALHLCLVLCLVRLYGYKAFLIYCFLYLLFLAPILLIPMKGAHYLYGSSIALSLGIAALLHQKWSGHWGCKLVGIAGLVLLVLHSIILQDYIYSIGTCMNRAMTSTEALYLSHGRPQAIDFQAEPGAPEHVLHRINTGREQIGTWFPVMLTVSKWGQTRPENALPLAMSEQCLVYMKQSFSSDADEAVLYFSTIIQKFVSANAGNTQHDVTYLKNTLGADYQGRFISGLGSGYIGYETSIEKPYVLLSGIIAKDCVQLIKKLRADTDIRIGEFGNSVNLQPDSSDMSAFCKSGNMWFVL